jgi:hypothetical protein
LLLWVHSQKGVHWVHEVLYPHAPLSDCAPQTVTLLHHHHHHHQFHPHL